MIRKDTCLSSGYTTTPTDPAFSPQKFRGHTLEILGALRECGGLTTREISDKIGEPVKKIYEYCRRGYHRGIINKFERWGWNISPLGNLVLSLTTTTTTTNHTTTTQPPHNHHTTTTQNSRQLHLAAFTSRADITDPDKSVVVELAAHYERTGVKFRLFKDQYELSEAMKISIDELLPTLRHLREEGCIYFRREDIGWKVGLMKGFVERLKYV